MHNMSPASWDELQSILALIANLDDITLKDTGVPNTAAKADVISFASRGLALLQGTETA